MSFDLADVLKGVSNSDTSREQIEYIRLDQIDGDPNNFYQLSGIEDLAANIALCGLQQPVRVREKPDGRYVTVSGHRRRAALELLSKDDSERWREVPCIVERDTVSPALQQLRLIYANANTRTMTSAELGEQAAQVEKLLYQLKEEGYEFPGRMRDHVAQAVNASKTKLARLKVIRSNLIPQFMRLWEADKLNETVAYTLAGQTAVRQKAIWIGATNDGKTVFSLTAETLNYRFGRMDMEKKQCNALTCKFGVKCDHVYVRQEHIAAGTYMVCSGCCVSCLQLVDCKFSCPYADDKKRKLKEKAKTEKKKAADEKKAAEQPEKDLLALVYSRVKQLRKDRNISAEDFVVASLGFAYGRDIERLDALELGKAPSLNDRMPGGIWAREAQRLIAVADLLGCTLDYLLGRSEYNLQIGVDLAAAPENVSNMDTWHAGNPQEPGDYVVYVSCCGIPYADSFHWNGHYWDCGGEPVDEGDEVLKWTYPPEVEAD